MIKELLTKEFIRTQVSCHDWKDALHEGMLILLEKSYVEKSYEEAVLRNFEKHGTYMVIAPGMVLSHARPEDGVNKLGISLINLKEGVPFGHELHDPVYLVITLATTDNTIHLEALKELMGILMDSKKYETLLYSKDKEEILGIIRSA